MAFMRKKKKKKDLEKTAKGTQEQSEEVREAAKAEVGAAEKEQ